MPQYNGRKFVYIELDKFIQGPLRIEYNFYLFTHEDYKFAHIVIELFQISENYFKRGNLIIRKYIFEYFNVKLMFKIYSRGFFSYQHSFIFNLFCMVFKQVFQEKFI